MKVDHLIADVHRTCRRILTNLQSQSAIKREDRVGVLHGESDVVETPDAACRLRTGPWSGCRRGRAVNKSPSGDSSRFSHAYKFRSNVLAWTGRPVIHSKE